MVKKIEFKIVFVRDRNRIRQWFAITSTDIFLFDDEIIRIYGKRWDIEFFSKSISYFENLVKNFKVVLMISW
ncbi:hypothetical protein F502_01775 [Clostridium pasteurianum DSM 525 = ATCC 6013]|nr:hypothetical protein AQ983_02280 [Clostridium pasteurianum DSM 525 = ATCC 6013]AOZ77790.1 hypothetical protein AQ984_02280 [Clostridium pasteurianum]ELP61144.1 hypothetical protein F502_01775 [Clostridium pasteurianum DSM 525 = ATCC 6013]